MKPILKVQINLLKDSSQDSNYVAAYAPLLVEGGNAGNHKGLGSLFSSHLNYTPNPVG